MATPKKEGWNFNLVSGSSSKSRNPKLDPPGFAEYIENDSQRSKTHKKDKTDQETADREVQIANLKIKKAWDAALAPGKSIPMNGFMLWMSGNSIQIFSVLITVMLLWNSLKAIMNVNSVFERFSSKEQGVARPQGLAALMELSKDPLLYPKVIYVILQCGCLALGVWKCGAMGLLPTATSDWLAFMEPKKILEHALGGTVIQ
ncbi:hypothetical protein BC832DRAFT_590220 [Gaertneriomyces semiglobifer]|nr:hypothetical protein BC832DRAFT_590220 [Gaertneriomyces semiglobifer]